MSGFVLSPQARADLESIWDYTAHQWGTGQAEKYTRPIAAAIQALACEPARGRTCDGVRKGYRKQAAGSHAIFYRLIEDGIDVVRILHRGMDPGRHLD
ncbi:MAG: type II toxin-antitoxin system RelE/ParE family toxin [Rhodomicrobium sp.]